MIRDTMYRRIKKYKSKGLSKKEISERFSIDPRTVKKYWNMSRKGYNQYRATAYAKESLFASFKEEIKQYQEDSKKKLSAIAIYDVLEEKHGVLPGSERGFRDYIKNLWDKGELVLVKHSRPYIPVEELPAGKQLQLDFGQYTTSDGMKLYFQTAVLSCSRYKLVLFQEKPIKTIDAILFLLFCFEEIKGRIEEIVIDQDAVLVTSENKGDIKLTKKFEQFVEEQELKLFVCRKADPESKGKVENLVGYVKKNFLPVRKFETIDEVNLRCREWLKRRANGRPSAATGRVPAELLPLEQEKLRPLKHSLFSIEDNEGFESRAVDSLCRISVQAVKYDLPEEYRGKQVDIKVIDGQLYIHDQITSEEITNYRLGDTSASRYRKEREHRKEQKSKELMLELKGKYSSEKWRGFVERNYSEFQRYFRDQHSLAEKMFSDSIDIQILEDAIDFCCDVGTYSFTCLDDTYQALTERKEQEEKPIKLKEITELKTHYPAPFTVARRAIGKYAERTRTVNTYENKQLQAYTGAAKHTKVKWHSKHS
ncbi:MAG: IS21 family transposase [Thermodesulfobacteriota bacterium]|nr:IS21 family transposase [Thermodesulfobacteriota bacterium]